ncbi:MAG: hydantoinase B/oxoprolinase family protein [Leptolyngbyaceae cyanobacterium]
MATAPTGRWQFWIDRGGTFTDIVAYQPDGTLKVHKLLSENPERYSDASIQGIRDVMGLAVDQPIPVTEIEAIKMGTTVATNALLERTGDRTVLAITKGFRDALRIGYQNRPQIFARQIVLPEMLYERVVEVEERYSPTGEELKPVNLEQVQTELQVAYEVGIRSCAIVLMHGYRYPDHEQQVAAIAATIGFTQISVSHQVSPLMKLVSRGDTTVVDAYLSPILRRYVEQVIHQLGRGVEVALPHLMFMQSNGGLAHAHQFQGKDSILSGPAGGIVGAVQTSRRAGLTQIISFDMGGTSTDVAHYNGEYERAFDTEVAGVRMRTPIMAIHTVAAGGGSILAFDGARYRVGPASAGAHPGPACYRKNGPLTVTDGNLMVGKIQPAFFPAVFGPEGNLPLDPTVVRHKFAELAQQIQAATGDVRSPEQVAQGFLAIAVEKMASAIKKISVQRGYDITEYTLCCFGGAAGQHACQIAESLGIRHIFLHPYAGVLSAYGMGLADQRVLRERSLEARLTPDLLPVLEEGLSQLAAQAQAALLEQDQTLAAVPERLQVLRRVHLKYEGTDSFLVVNAGNLDTMIHQFEQAHYQRYGLIAAHKPLIVEAIAVEAIGSSATPDFSVLPQARCGPLQPATQVSVYTGNCWQETPVFRRDQLQPGDTLPGPALIMEATSTIMVEPGWAGKVTGLNHIFLQKEGVRKQGAEDRGSQIFDSEQQSLMPDPQKLKISRVQTMAPDPVLLEIFNHLFMAIAEQMGFTLQNTAYSVNIKERLDFSCAIFDQQGQLVANAPHIPVHLGSMGESVISLLRDKGDRLKPGDVYVSNNPYNGGTHLPDITVITPVFASQGDSRVPLFFVASRGHHADVGGITPGSMPPGSTHIQQEGILIDNFQLVSEGQFREAELLELLTASPYPVRNLTQNLADLKAQIAANEKGVQELHKMVAHFGLETVRAYMQHVQDNAEASVRRVIQVLNQGQFIYEIDDGCQIQVQVSIDRKNRRAEIDFTGTSPQQPSNINAPLAVCKAAVLYVFRTLVDDDIPLNAGCLKPLDIIVPEGCLLNPRYPAAVVAGNVETSQGVADALYGALGVMAASQGTMNNFTFGNDRYQYYETICGGSGAGPTFDGTDAVHTHMTNSRLTDPEVLEWRFPVLLETFEIRRGSGGQGRHAGGNGVMRSLQFREPMTAAILSGHRRIPPFGLKGGQPGAVGKNRVERADGSLDDLGGNAEVTMQPGDRFVIETPGGGGYGSNP